MDKDDVLRLAVKDVVDALARFVEKSSHLEWTPKDGALILITRSVIRRQWESLSIVGELVDKSQGFVAVGLLRPACEEFLWIKYFASIPRPYAEELITLMGKKEILDSLRAQDIRVGRSTTKAMGLESYLIRCESESKDKKRLLKKLGTELKWEPKTVEAGKLPSTAFIAKATGETKLYNFLYHASSRFVHFSTQELLRRSWGGDGFVTINSGHFTDYWDQFVLYWGVDLMISSFAEASKLDENSTNGEMLIDVGKINAAATRIGQHGPVPIITAKELYWKD